MQYDPNNPQSIQDLKPEQIQTLTAEQVAQSYQYMGEPQKAQILENQWSYGNNLEKADDLSKYPEAQKAIQNKYNIIISLPIECKGFWAKIFLATVLFALWRFIFFGS